LTLANLIALHTRRSIPIYVIVHLLRVAKKSCLEVNASQEESQGRA
jgi:uncharacterized protein YqfA (UPF0365 family)